jgi:hypothetical protein
MLSCSPTDVQPAAGDGQEQGALPAPGAPQPGRRRCACCAWLQVRAAASGVNEALSICGLLVGMAQRDAKVGPGWLSFACNAAQRAAGPSLVCCTADTGLGAPPAGSGARAALCSPGSGGALRAARPSGCTGPGPRPLVLPDPPPSRLPTGNAEEAGHGLLLPVQGAMRQGTLDCLLAIQLRRDAPREVAGSHASECAARACVARAPLCLPPQKMKGKGRKHHNTALARSWLPWRCSSQAAIGALPWSTSAACRRSAACLPQTGVALRGVARDCCAPPPCLLGSPAALAVAELCATYDGAVGHGASGLAAAQACVDALEGEAAAPAAAVLHTLLTQLWHKPVGGAALPARVLGLGAGQSF